MKRNFFKSKTAGLLLASMLIIPTAFLVTACGGEPTPEKLDRTNNVEVVNISQDYQGNVFMEIENFYHEGYEVESDGGITSSSLEFSINGSEWARGDYIADYYDQYKKAIYYIMYYDFSSDEFKGGDDSFAVGETVNISVRIPESDTYKASEGKNVASYTLKNVPSSISDSFYPFVDTTPDNIGTSSVEGSEFTFYVDGSTLKVGRYQTSPREDDDWFDRSLIRFEKLTEQDKVELDALNLEYKLLDFNPTLINETPIKGTNYVSKEIGDVDFAENYFHTVSPSGWTPLKQRYAVNTNVADNKIWDLNSYVEDDFGGYSLVNSKSLVLLVRRGETQSTGVSKVLQINYDFPQTSSLLDTSGDYVKIETTEDGQQPANPTQATQAMTDWITGDMEKTATAGYNGAIKFDYSDATDKYQLQGTVANKYDEDKSLQIFTTNTVLSDLINGGFNYTISGKINTDTTPGATDKTEITISHGTEKPKYIFDEDMTSLILQALQIDIINNMMAFSDFDLFESIDSDYMKIKITFEDGEAYYIFDSDGNFVGHRLAFLSDTMSYSIEFRIN